MTDSDHDFNDAQNLRHDFERLRASLDGMKDRLGENAHEVLARVSAYLERDGLDARLDDLGGKLKDSGRDAAAKLESEVTAKPLASVAIAFGIGLLAANLLRRR